MTREKSNNEKKSQDEDNIKHEIIKTLKIE